jgi:hypothetical protein
MAPALSPQLNRLDRILELVTDHEANYREQVLEVDAWNRNPIAAFGCL